MSLVAYNLIDTAHSPTRAQEQAVSNTCPPLTDSARTGPTAQTDEHARLSLERIFASKDLHEQKLPTMRWSQRTSHYFTRQATSPENQTSQIVRIDPATGVPEVVVTVAALTPVGETAPLAVDDFELSADETKLLIYTNSQRVWRRKTRGDYWVFDRATQRLQKLGGDAASATLMYAKFSPDGMQVAYVREHNLYVQDLRTLRITALTSDGSREVLNGTADWVNEEELEIYDAYRWSPTGQALVFWQFDTTGVRRFHLLHNTVGSYPEIVSFPYPKVGETNSATRLGVVQVTGGPVRWLKVPGDPREHYLARAEWTPDGTHLLLQQFNRLQNKNCVLLANAKTGATRAVFTESDPAWLENENPVRWVEPGRSFLWLSERDGWRHAYLVNMDGKTTRITQGDFDVIEVEAVDAAAGWLYYAASPQNATQQYLYRVPLTGGAPERLSPAAQPGCHKYSFSPDAQWAVHTYSTLMQPPVVELVRLQQHQVVRVLIDNEPLRAQLAALYKPSAEFVRLDIGQGTTLDAWCLKPPDFDSARKYPLVVYVYGEPAGQTVRDAWAGDRGLWHWLLAQHGYVVASVDNRGTKAPRGRAWRKSVHRQIGILAAQDQADATRALLKLWPAIDAKRIGIWGWSGGGSMSLNAIFRYPELYHTAIAVAPNANQLLYDTIYQERYMGLPPDNVDGYRDGSPLTHAHRLQGNLLVVHGTADDNGHYQGTELLLNELIAHNKRFTVMPYPGRSHAISEGDNTTHHFYSLLKHYFDENLREARPRTSDVPPNPGHTVQGNLSTAAGTNR